MDQRNHEFVEIDIKELTLIILRKWYVIVILGILGALVTGAISKFLITPSYTSTSELYIINREQEDMTTWSDMQSGEFLAKDFRVLVKSRTITEEVIRNLKLNMTHDQLSSMISIYIPEGTRILDIMVTYVDPEMAKQLVDEVARVSSERLVSIMEIGEISIVEEGNLPLKPAGPNVGINSILGGTIGIFLTSFILLLRHIVNDTIRTSEDIEKYLGLTALGLIPKEEGTKLNKTRIDIDSVRKIVLTRRTRNNQERRRKHAKSDV